MSCQPKEPGSHRVIAKQNRCKGLQYIDLHYDFNSVNKCPAHVRVPIKTS
jgi:hypothetical protein